MNISNLKDNFLLTYVFPNSLKCIYQVDLAFCIINWPKILLLASEVMMIVIIMNITTLTILLNMNNDFTMLSLFLAKARAYKSLHHIHKALFIKPSSTIIAYNREEEWAKTQCVALNQNYNSDVYHHSYENNITEQKAWLTLKHISIMYISFPKHGVFLVFFFYLNLQFYTI